MMTDSASGRVPERPVRSERAERGAARRRELFGERPSEAREPAAELAPWLIDRSDEAHFGTIWTRPNLDRRSRSMLTIAVLTALGHDQPLRSTRNPFSSPSVEPRLRCARRGSRATERRPGVR